MRVSRQIGWSDKSNVLYNILQELEAISCKIACSNTTTTTTSTTTTPPCNTYVLLQTPAIFSYTGVGCDGNSISGTPAGSGVTLCAQSITYAGPLYNLDSSCNPECILYQISIDPVFGGEYIYTNCEGIQIGPVTEPGGGTFYICAKPGTIGGNNVTFTQIGPCKCVEYQINGGLFGGTYSYIGCDFSNNKSIPIGAEESIIVCALAIPTVSDPINMGVDVIGICNP